MRIDAVAPLPQEGAVAPQLHRQLRNRIISCELEPGQRISETDIAAGYRVSRQPVREAFIKLAGENLVSVRPQRGTYVGLISVSAALSARFIREAVEADLVRRVVERATPEMVTALEDQVVQQRGTAEAGDPSGFMRLDETFHRMLAAFADAPDVSDYLDNLNVQMNRVRNISARQFAPGKLVDQHGAVVDAIRRGDADAADQAMRIHLREFKKDLPRIVDAYPDYFDHIEALT
ncbi:GntR family transcriptional regulator [Pseudoruegeria sp. SK021]|uniref:GntR family transcriptional regulator n=1 Tax=Pseudoruegeria sp. SK021 TaxID=1933035 RepID=UPI000A21686E|nr:GntR family transcriptional regulator [Pseudoruegeria sp. SK021]OSP55592.1 hypothetical protein BV911_06925 [Pseudoruegeria sp. SK021]